MIKWFKFNHLPLYLQDTASSCAELADKMDATLGVSTEKTAGLRKLLEAKDCFVRATIEDRDNKEGE